MFAASAAMAQTAPAPAPQDDQEAAVLDEVVVTGTRLRLPDYVASNPVVSVTSETIQYSGVTNVTDLLTDFPAVSNSFNSVDSADTGGSASVGLNLLNLRNLGTQRTLVLVNGRRHVASDPGSAAIDTNTIPIGLIDNVEILTGGASALYGADGVSGVVNFVLKERFEGIDVRAQTGWTEDGGGERSFFSALYGRNFFNDRLNLTIAGEVAIDEAISQFDRDYTTPGRREVLVGNPDDLPDVNGNDDPNLPDNVFFRDVRYPDSSRGGSVYTDLDFGDSLYGFDFEGAGPVWRDGQLTSGFPVIGGSGTLLDDFVDDLSPAQDRYVINTTGRLTLTDDHELFWEGKFARIETGFTAQPTYDFGYGPDNAYLFLGLWTGIDNPFMPTSIRNDAINNPDGLGNPALAALLGVDPGVFIQRDNFDLGYTGREITRDTSRFVLGMEGNLTPGLTYEISAVYGQTKTDSLYLNNRINDRFLAAIDVVQGPNGPTCRSNLDPSSYFSNPNIDPRVGARTFTPGANSGCVALNIFGDGSPSPEALAWVRTDSASSDTIEQTQFLAFLSGDSEPLFTLPAGPVSFALGLEYRREQSQSRVSDEAALAQSVTDTLGAGEQLPYDVTWEGSGQDSGGSFDVAEIFGEISIPLLKDLPFADTLTLDGAYRYSDYSTAGGNAAWKIGLLYRPVDWILLRGTEAKSVRAPNIGELFLPQVQTNALLVDPCDADNIDLGTDNREANCLAALAAAGVANPAAFQNTNSGSVQGRVGGNPDLDVEEAETTTYGIVIQPPIVPGLTLSVDYYDIELTNAIQFFSAQTIVDQCYDLPAGNQFCDLITRRSQPGNGQGFIDSFEQFALNVAAYNTSGYDFTIRYSLDPADFGVQRDIGRFAFSLTGSKLEELEFIELDTPDSSLGFPGAPEWITSFDATWTWRDFLVNYGFTYYDETFRIDPLTLAAEPDFVEEEYRMFSALKRHDIQARWNIDDRFAVYGGINNFTNQEPDRGSFATPIGPQGRTFYIGATFRQ
ncbi:MAG: TonB-dependent receptor domain-containing protein [Brevundimonas sp.]